VPKNAMLRSQRVLGLVRIDLPKDGIEDEFPMLRFSA